tara:strand:+ start:274 stop:2004 length:1731 start_codon:yes stop_codon:yes gene_type:complete
MKVSLLRSVLAKLKSSGELITINEEIDPNLDIATRHLQEFRNKGKALLFKKVKGSKYSAVSNIFGTLYRSKLLFPKGILEDIKALIGFKINPLSALKNPIKSIKIIYKAYYAIPKKVNFPSNFEEIKISDLPQIKSWPNDGGAFITLPQVYSESVDKPGLFNSNLGMYRIQMSGNEYINDKEIGMHYQIHRGIGVHHKQAIKINQPLKVSIFVGGHPAHTFAAVMPLPEGIPEISFAGVLAKRRFRYALKDGYVISTDADFVICGEIYENDLKPEGPFGDHLGYYSLKHSFPFVRVKHVYAKKDGIWPFTVVGRPPQEDSQFGKLIHEITGKAVEAEIPGLKSVNAVDVAGVHPLLLAIGSERYTPFNPTKRPMELLTIAHHILGTGQMSLAKYLFICDDYLGLDINNEKEFFTHFLERVDWKRDLHFLTKTTIDTLDYSTKDLNEGSKVIIAAAGEIKRKLINKLDQKFNLPNNFNKINLISNGNLVVEGSGKVEDLIVCLEKQKINGIGLITIVDDIQFVSKEFNNWLWVTFTRSDPASDISGLNAEVINKHFSFSIPIIDARIKKHHAPVLER